MSQGYKVKFDALKVSQPIGEFYCGVMDAADLVAISRADVRRLEDNELDSYLGIQRPLKNFRVKQINKYIGHIDATFPNSVIVAIKSEYIDWDGERKELVVDPGESETDEVALILDGQHRLAGFDENNSNFLSSEGEECPFQVLVTVFVEADISTQAGIFATVNLAQTKVNKSLVYDLESLAESRSPERTCHDVAVILNSDESGPFYKSVKRLGVATKGVKGEFLTQAAFVENLVKFISPDPAADKDTLLAKKRGFFRGKSKELEYQDDKSLRRYFFRRAFIESRDEIIAANLSNYFTAVESRWAEAWVKSSVESSLNKSIGFIALMRVFRDIYKYLVVPISEWDRVLSVSEFADILEESDIESQFFIDLDPTTKSAKTIYDAILRAIDI